MKLTLAIQPLEEADGRPGGVPPSGYFAQIEADAARNTRRCSPREKHWKKYGPTFKML